MVLNDQGAWIANFLKLDFNHFDLESTVVSIFGWNTCSRGGSMNFLRDRGSKISKLRTNCSRVGATLFGVYIVLNEFQGVWMHLPHWIRIPLHHQIFKGVLGGSNGKKRLVQLPPPPSPNLEILFFSLHTPYSVFAQHKNVGHLWKIGFMPKK